MIHPDFQFTIKRHWGRWKKSREKDFKWYRHKTKFLIAVEDSYHYDIFMNVMTYKVPKFMIEWNSDWVLRECDKSWEFLFEEQEFYPKDNKEFQQCLKEWESMWFIKTKWFKKLKTYEEMRKEHYWYLVITVNGTISCSTISIWPKSIKYKLWDCKKPWKSKYPDE